MPVNVYYVITASAANSKAGTVWCAVLAFNNLACFSTDMQFIRCACMLEYRFKVVNNELENIASVWHFKRGLVCVDFGRKYFLLYLCISMVWVKQNQCFTTNKKKIPVLTICLEEPICEIKPESLYSNLNNL